MKENDLISRQAAIKMLFDGFDYVDDESFGYILAQLKTMPSAQPEINLEDIKKYCEERGLTITTREWYDELISYYQMRLKGGKNE